MRGMRHVTGFARYWNRPLDRKTRRSLWYQIAVMALLGLLLGVFGAYFGLWYFMISIASWTGGSVRGYRRSLAGDEPPAGDRFKVYDRDDIWGGRWPF
jgi:hypothetical protein